MWVKIDDAFFSNPKVIKAAPLARSLYVAGLCHCATGLTDGAIDKAAVPLLLAQTGAPRSAVKSLLDVGMWLDRTTHYEVKDYLLYNPSRDRTEQEREAARERKARQRERGRAGVDQGADGRFVPKESHGESRRDAHRESQGESPATRPVPSRPPSSSPPSTTTNPPEVAGAGAPPEDDQPRTPERTAALAIEHMARCDLRTAEAAGTPIRQPDRWLTKATETRRAAHHDDLVHAATERPAADPVTLAEEIDPACGPDDGGLARAKAEAAKSARAAEDQAARRAENAAWREQADAILEGLDTDDFTALADQARETNPTLLRHEMRRLAMEHHAPQETAAP